jgi:hypothetical protein
MIYLFGQRLAKLVVCSQPANENRSTWQVDWVEKKHGGGGANPKDYSIICQFTVYPLLRFKNVVSYTVTDRIIL